jgi:hypothetical protein
MTAAAASRQTTRRTDGSGAAVETARLSEVASVTVSGPSTMVEIAER